MFMVVVLHILGQGGILDAAVPGSINYWAAWFLEAAMYCAVDCFALISGYVLSVTNTKISRIAEMWFQTLFYSVLITVLFFLFLPEAAISKTDILISCFPIITKRYWYVSAYFGMYIIVPLLNVALLNMKRKTLEIIFMGMLFAFGGFSVKFDPFNLGQGCSVMWLSLLYLLGGYFRKYDIISKVRRNKGRLLFGSMTCLTFLSKYIIETFTALPSRNEDYATLLLSFVSPTVLMAGVGLFIAVAQMKFSKPMKKIISVFSPAALGVYLIHTCKPVWDSVFKGFAKDFVNYGPVGMILSVLACAVVIYFSCSIIELLRIKLFKILRIHALSCIIEVKSKKFVDRLCLKFERYENLLPK